MAPPKATSQQHERPQVLHRQAIARTRGGRSDQQQIILPRNDDGRKRRHNPQQHEWRVPRKRAKIRVKHHFSKNNPSSDKDGEDLSEDERAGRAALLAKRHLEQQQQDQDDNGMESCYHNSSEEEWDYDFSNAAVTTDESRSCRHQTRMLSRGTPSSIDGEGRISDNEYDTESSLVKGGGKSTLAADKAKVRMCARKDLFQFAKFVPKAHFGPEYDYNGSVFKLTMHYTGIDPKNTSREWWATMLNQVRLGIGARRNQVRNAMRQVIEVFLLEQKKKHNDPEITSSINLGKIDLPTYICDGLKNNCNGYKNCAVLKWYLKSLLPCALRSVDHRQLRTKKRVSNITDVSDEAFVLVVLDNNWEQWKQMYWFGRKPPTKSSSKEEKAAFPRAKYTASQKSDTGLGGSNGWSMVGIKKYDEYCKDHVPKMRKAAERKKMEVKIKKDFLIENDGKLMVQSREEAAESMNKRLGSTFNTWDVAAKCLQEKLNKDDDDDDDHEDDDDDDNHGA